MRGLKQQYQKYLQYSWQFTFYFFFFFKRLLNFFLLKGKKQNYNYQRKYEKKKKKIRGGGGRGIWQCKFGKCIFCVSINLKLIPFEWKLNIRF